MFFTFAINNSKRNKMAPLFTPLPHDVLTEKHGRCCIVFDERFSGVRSNHSCMPKPCFQKPWGSILGVKHNKFLAQNTITCRSTANFSLKTAKRRGVRSFYKSCDICLAASGPRRQNLEQQEQMPSTAPDVSQTCETIKLSRLSLCCNGPGCGLPSRTALFGLTNTNWAYKK